ncbi:GNAT family N-acetyltransferase [Flavobacterium sp. XGLA_31]|uniref:GNAT family N-acetyltransferase n=1 Tax=Flavobacterium sp. XGLA_31 TaxID=3447666 RepID=UPI003F3AB628
MEFEILTTERLLLRKINPDTHQYIYTNYTDDALCSFLGLSSTETLRKEKEKFNGGLYTFNKSYLYFQILDKKDEKVIGWCGYHTWYLDHNRAEIGYGLFDETYKNKGLMHETLKAVLDYGFNQMNLHRVEAFIGKDNIPSLKSVAKFGFTQEGILREHYFTNNQMEDSVVFSLLKQEYQALSNML